MPRDTKMPSPSLLNLFCYVTVMANVLIFLRILWVIKLLFRYKFPSFHAHLVFLVLAGMFSVSKVFLLMHYLIL